MPEKSRRQRWVETLQNEEFHSFSTEQKMSLGREFTPATNEDGSYVTSDEDLYNLIGGYEEKFGKRSTASAIFRKSFGQTFAETLPDTGAAAGGVIGSIPGLVAKSKGLTVRGAAAGSAAGTFAGGRTKELIQENFPNLFGDPSLAPQIETLQDVALDIGISAVTAGTGKLFGLGAKGFKVAKGIEMPWLQKLIGSPVIGHWLTIAREEVDDATLNAMLKYARVPNSMAQMMQTGSNIAGAIAQRTFRNVSQRSYKTTMKEYNRLIEAETKLQGGKLNIKLGKNPLLSDVTLGGRIQKQIKGFRAMISEMESKYYPELSEFANSDKSLRHFTQEIPAVIEKNKDVFSGKMIEKTIKPIETIPKEVHGPVFANKFATNIDDIQQMIDRLNDNESIVSSLGLNEIKRRFKPLIELLNNLKSQTNGVIKNAEGEVMPHNIIMSYDDANEIRRSLGRLSEFQQVDVGSIENGFRGLYHNLRDDIFESMKKDWGNEEVSATLKRAFDLTVFRHKIGKPKLLAMVQDNNSTGIINYISGSSGNAKEIVEMLGGRPPKHLLKMKKDPRGLVGLDIANQYGKEGSGNVEIQSRYMRHLMEITRNTADDTWDAGKAYNLFDNTDAGIIAEIFPNTTQRSNIRQFLKAAQHTAELPPKGGTIALQARKGSFLLRAIGSPAYGGIGLGVLIGAENFTGKVLLDKKLGTQAIKMLRSGADTEISKRWTRDVFLALKGIQIGIQTSQGIREGYIDENGIPRLNQE